MSRTVSFRASEELDEYLEELAEERMTTKSTVANMLVAERIRQIRDDEEEESEEVEDDGEVSESDEPTTEPEEGEEGGDEGLPGVFERHSDKWYRPDTEEDYMFAVRMPEGDGTNRKYYKTVRYAANRLRKEYE
jgi:predicted transcriptional regulator